MTQIWLTSNKYIRESEQIEKRGGGREKFLLNLNFSVEAFNISGQSDTQGEKNMVIVVQIKINVFQYT